jgi:hypothetical protein
MKLVLVKSVFKEELNLIGLIGDEAELFHSFTQSMTKQYFLFGFSAIAAIKFLSQKF